MLFPPFSSNEVTMDGTVVFSNGCCFGLLGLVVVDDGDDTPLFVDNGELGGDDDEEDEDRSVRLALFLPKPSWPNSLEPYENSSPSVEMRRTC